MGGDVLQSSVSHLWKKPKAFRCQVECSEHLVQEAVKIMDLGVSQRCGRAKSQRVAASS